MQIGRDRLEALAEAVAKAEPDLDEPQRRVALETCRRLAKGSPAPVADIAERAGEGTDRVEELLASWPGVFRDDGVAERGRARGDP